VMRCGAGDDIATGISAEPSMVNQSRISRARNTC
jgi:hypothetical protein